MRLVLVMDEYIDIVDKNGQLTGEICLKSHAHKTGLYHNTVHVWLYTKDGDILLQQRSFKKEICPGLWDVSAAGHVDSGELLEEAAIRETYEELGLKLTKKDLKKIGVFLKEQQYANGITDNEFHHTFIAPLEIPLDQLTYDSYEVENIKLISTKDFLDKLDMSTTNNHFIDSNKPYYLKVLEAIKNQF